LLLIASNLEERRLLFAELKEAGYEVLPVPGLLPAMQALFSRLLTPPLILIDVQGDPYATPQHVEELLQFAAGVPVVLLIGVFGSEDWKPLEPRLAALLLRPIRIGEVVETVRRMMAVHA
jgi:DNA-binding response OmpR family regulator